MSVRLARLLPFVLIGASLATPALAKTKHSGNTASSSASSLTWRGDITTAHGVVQEVAKAWEKAGHGHIQLEPFNTASGIDAVAHGTADLAGSARPSDGSAEDAPLTFTPVAWDGLVVITNPSNPVKSLTLKQLHDIYYGKIHNWNEVGGKNAPIDVYAVASPGDGVEYSLRSLLFGRGNQPVAAPRLYVNTNKLIAGVKLNPNGIGAATLASVNGDRTVKMISINDVAPSVANLADGSYVLFTPLYLVTNPASPKAAETQTFIDFVQSDKGKVAMRKHAVLPYQDGIALASLDSSRRSKILAAVGARASKPAVAAPGATYASRVAVAPTSADTLAAKRALERRTAAEKTPAAAEAAKPDLKKVKGSVAEVSVTGLAHTEGSATASVTSLAHAKGTATIYTPGSAHNAKTYKVVRGDTLFSIARKYSVNVAQLRDWNHLKGDQVKPGQQLRVSAR